MPKKINLKANNVTYKHVNSSYSMFLSGTDVKHNEIRQFNRWVTCLKKEGVYTFESAKAGEQKCEVKTVNYSGESKRLINFTTYNYLGYGCHQEVKNAVKAAIDKYGTGAASSPLIGGNFILHKKLEEKIIKFMGFDHKYGASIFSTGYGVNVGVISACMHPGTYVILDGACHASLFEGARLSGAAIRIFKHNNMGDLERVLDSIKEEKVRKIICCEGVYSTSGEKGNIVGIVSLAKKYGASTLVDEAHSMAITGDHGRGICEEQGVLDKVDMIIVTFSKAFCSLGGALIAKKEISRYVDFFAKIRILSAAMPPAISAGIVKIFELINSPEGRKRRKTLMDNAEYMRNLLGEKVNILNRKLIFRE